MMLRRAASLARRRATPASRAGRRALAPAGALQAVRAGPACAVPRAALSGTGGGSHSDFEPVRKAGDGGAAAAAPGPVDEVIRDQVGSNKVFLYMKGVPAAPQCGFSSHVAKILEVMGVEYAACNVLENQDVREGIKAFSGWPTIPQLYVDGEFVGGADIVNEMYHSGELRTLLEGADALPKE